MSPIAIGNIDGQRLPPYAAPAACRMTRKCLLLADFVAKGAITDAASLPGS
jgi:hypothetical protein